MRREAGRLSHAESRRVARWRGPRAGRAAGAPLGAALDEVPKSCGCSDGKGTVLLPNLAMSFPDLSPTPLSISSDTDSLKHQ